MPLRHIHRPFRAVRFGVETLPRGFDAPRHQHLHSYASVILEGSFEEAGFAGRIRTEPGDILIHGCLDSHQNKMLSKQVTLLRLTGHFPARLEGLYHLNEVEAIVDAALRDAVAGLALLRDSIAPATAKPATDTDWPDRLAHALRAGERLILSDWARDHRLSNETISRGFKAAFGVTPALYRLEHQARTACRAITACHDALADIACATGFADQAHMTRAVRRFTGFSPGQWKYNPSLDSPNR